MHPPNAQKVFSLMRRSVNGQFSAGKSVSHLIQERRLRFFGLVARADLEQDLERVIGTSFRQSSHWVDADVQSANIGRLE